MEIARTNKSSGVAQKARLSQKYITLQSRYLVRFCIEQLRNSRCWRCDISTSVEIMLFAFTHVCFSLRALDVEDADVRQDVTQWQAADRFLSSATTRYVVTQSTKFRIFRPKSGILGGEGLETVAASGPCCNRFGGLLAKRLLCHSEHSSLHHR